MAATYGAITPEELNAFKLEDVESLMMLAEKDQLQLFSTLDSILEIPRATLSFQCSDKSGSVSRMIRNGGRLRETISRFIKNTTNAFAAKLIEGLPEDAVSIAEKKFGVKFVKGAKKND